MVKWLERNIYQKLLTVSFLWLVTILPIGTLWADTLPSVISPEFENQELFDHNLSGEWYYLPNSSQLEPKEVVLGIDLIKPYDSDFDNENWLIIRLYNESEVRDFSLRFMSQLDKVRVAEFENNIDQIKNDHIGMMVYNPDHLVLPRMMSYEFLLDRKDTLVLMFKGDFPSDTPPKITLSRASQMRSFSNNYDRISYMFSAVFLMMMLYNMSILSIVRDKSYAFYSLMASGYFLHAFNYQLEYWFEPLIASHVTIISATIISVGGMGFWGSFLGINKGFWYWLWQLASLLGVLIIVSVLAFLFWGNYTNDTFGFLSLLAACLALLCLLIWSVSSVLFAYQGVRNARLFLLANAPLAIGGIYFIYVWLNRTYGNLELSADQIILTNYILFGSLALQMILFSISIGYKIKKASIAQIESEKKQRHLLESVVSERTEMLRSTNESLVDKNAELENTNKIKNRLLTILSHDLRTPINNLSSFVGLLKTNEFSQEEIAQIVPEIEKSLIDTSDFMLSLIRWTQSQNEGLTPSKSYFDTVELIEQNVGLLRKSIDEKQLDVDANVTTMQGYGDKNMIDLVIRNLMSNAVKFSRDKGKISVRGEQDNGQIIITVEDTGVGISRDRFEKFFDPGIKNTTLGTAGEKGFGMGLILCKDFVELNDGDFFFESEEGKGSKFGFKIPSRPV